MFDFWKNEWKLFLEDINSVKNGFMKIFGLKKDYLMLEEANQEQQEVNLDPQEQATLN